MLSNVRASVSTPCMASQVEALAEAVRVITSDAKEMAAKLAALERDVLALAARLGQAGSSSSSRRQASELEYLLRDAARTVHGAVGSLEGSARAGDKYAASIAGRGGDRSVGASRGSGLRHPPLSALE